MSRPPNILWICTDQQRFDTVAALGNPYIRTPHLDRLVAEGVALRRAYCQNPVCTPSRASFLTGRYPSTIHVHRNGNAYFPDRLKLVTKILAEAGYVGGLVGKLHLSAAHGRVEPRPDDGYSRFEWSHHPYPEPFWPVEAHAYQRWLRDQGVRWEEEYQKDGSSGIAARYHQTTWCAEVTIQFLQENRDRPWFMSVNPFDPHPPMDPAPEFFARMDLSAMPLPLYQTGEEELQRRFRSVAHQTREPVPPHAYDARRMVAAYYAMIEHIDRELGRVLDALEETGQRENTIVVFMSDHGEMLGDHCLRLKGARFYEGAVHVPLIFSWPGRVQAGLQSDALVELIDVAPTLLDLCGLPIPAEWEGRSLGPILRGEASPDRFREFVRCEYHSSLPKLPPTHANMIFDGRYKLVLYHGLGLGELYDLQEDPGEFENRWEESAYREVREALVHRLFDALALSTDLGQPCVGLY